MHNPFEQSGLNLSLPDAHFAKKEIWDKLSLYEMAERDSVKYEQARERDPYFELIAFQTDKEQPKEKSEPQNANKLINSFPQKEKQSKDLNEERVNRKLEELIQEVNKGSANSTISKKVETTSSIVPDPKFTSDVDRLEKMMEMMNDNSEPDPEMEQIANVLEKILDIQHPERVKEKFKSMNQQSKANALPVEVLDNTKDITLISSSENYHQFTLSDSATSFQNYFSSNTGLNGFFGLDDEFPEEQQSGNAIHAIIHDSQELVEGATVRIRLLNDIQILGKHIPKDQFITGVCAINGERLTIDISSIRTGNSLLPVSLTVYDLDGLEGIYIPGAITRDASKQASDNALQNMQIMSLDPSLGAQAAAAGVEAAKGLLSKKAKLIKVTVKAGYQILLRDTNASNS